MPTEEPSAKCFAFLANVGGPAARWPPTKVYKRFTGAFLCAGGIALARNLAEWAGKVTCNSPLGPGEASLPHTMRSKIAPDIRKAAARQLALTW